MKVKILRSIGGIIDGRMRSYVPGDEVDLPDDLAKELIAAGSAERIAAKVKQKPKKTRKKAAVKVK
jgi:hypothetical protein